MKSDFGDITAYRKLPNINSLNKFSNIFYITLEFPGRFSSKIKDHFSLANLDFSVCVSFLKDEERIK